jgi:hypothetical protein
VGGKRVDTNHSEIVKGLRSIGATVQSLADVGKGCPDILVGVQGKNFALEIKDGAKTASRRKLTIAEEEWQAAWRGQVAVVNSLDEALRVIGCTD